MIVNMLRYRLYIAALGVLCSGFCLGLPVSANDGSFHLVTESQGDAKLQRKGQKVQPVHVGDRLRTTDRLLLGKGGRVKILCQNLTKWIPNTVGSFEIAKGCKMNGRSVLRSTNRDRILSRSSNDPKIPYIISPRNTSIIELKPLLKWNPVKGSKSYRVSVTGPDVNWETTVSQSQVMYGGNAPLKSGIRYRVIVTAESGETSTSDSVTGFERLDDDTVARLKANIMMVTDQKDINEEAAVLALAHLERSNELYVAAIERLTHWVAQGNQSAAVQQLLGNLYWQMGLSRPAREHYVTAQNLMQQDQNLLGEAEVLSQLGEVAQSLGQLKEAITWLEGTQKLYRELDDEEQAKVIEEKLINLRERI
jgi:hypothetical protein